MTWGTSYNAMLAELGNTVIIGYCDYHCDKITQKRVL